MEILGNAIELCGNDPMMRLLFSSIKLVLTVLNDYLSSTIDLK
jgi:hypothetical protein